MGGGSRSRSKPSRFEAKPATCKEHKQVSPRKAKSDDGSLADSNINKTAGRRKANGRDRGRGRGQGRGSRGKPRQVGRPKKVPEPTQLQPPKPLIQHASLEDLEVNGSCSFCEDDSGAPDNAIVFCECCHIGVHQKCYGVTKIPEGDIPWYCYLCEHLLKSEIKTNGSEVTIEQTSKKLTKRAEELARQKAMKTQCRLCLHHGPLAGGAFKRCNLSSSPLPTEPNSSMNAPTSSKQANAIGASSDFESLLNRAANATNASAGAMVTLQATEQPLALSNPPLKQGSNTNALADAYNNSVSHICSTGSSKHINRKDADAGDDAWVHSVCA